MWTLNNPDLSSASQDPNSGIPLTTVGSGGGIAWSLSAFNATAIPIPVYSNNIVNITLPAALIIQSVVGYSPALDPLSPQPGEFIWNPTTQVLTIYVDPTNPLIAGLTVGVVGISTSGNSNIYPVVNPGLPPQLLMNTDWVNPSLFTVFWNLPITGVINWTRSVEQHPSGSLNLFVLESGIDAVRLRFAKGQELEFAGIGFSVSNYQEKLKNTFEYPTGVYEVAVSLTGRYNRFEYLKPVFLKASAAGAIAGIGINNSIIYKDPDCSLSNYEQSQEIISVANSTNPIALAAQNSVPLDLYGNDWAVKVPLDTPQDTSVSWLSAVQERMRQNGAFLFFSHPGTVQAKGVDAVGFWSYSVPELEISSQGDYIRGDGKFGYAVEYPNVKVTGEFSEPPLPENEDIQTKPNQLLPPMWNKRSPILQTEVNGDYDIAVPPLYSEVLYDLSSNYDVSGPTKSLETTKTSDGLVIRRDVDVFGFAYLGWNIFSRDSNGVGSFYSLAAPYWRQIKKETEIFAYDAATGYLLGTYTTGWQLGRFGTEPASDLPPTVLAQESTDPIEIARGVIYEFNAHAIDGRSAYFLESYTSYYTDIPEQRFVEFKRCNIDGSSSPDYRADPTYIPDYFASREMHHRNTFAWMPHPDNSSALAQDPDYIPIPDLTTGEETMNRRHLVILPSKNTAFGNSEQIGDRYLEYSSQYSASGANYKDAAEETKVASNNGRPGVASRLPSLYERVQPNAAAPPPTANPTTNPDLFEYRLQSPGFTSSDPTGGTTSFPFAVTTAAALIAAKTDLQVRDAQESVSGSIEVPFNPDLKEFDKIFVATQFDYYQLRAISVSNSVKIQGTGNGLPILTAIKGTGVTIGIDRDIAVTLTSRQLPKKPNPPTAPTSTISIFTLMQKNDPLGSLLPNIPNRRFR